MPAKKGSNDLNLLLSAKVVKLKVELDYKGSKLSAQVDAISKHLEKKPVKLKVQLSATVKDMNAEIKKISDTITSSKSFKPLKMKVEMDVKGSADKIKKQLKEVMDVVNDFNKKYSKQLQQMQKANDVVKNSGKGMNIKNDAGVQGFNNIKQYMTQIEQAEKQLRGKFSDGKGLFSSTQIKDAQGNMHTFIATLERANGVVEKIKYSWNKDKNQFQVIDRQTATQTEKMVHKASQSLADLQREMGKTGKASKDLTKEYKELERAGKNGTLTNDMVKAYQTKVKNAIEEVRVQKELNALKREEAKLLRDIKNATKGTRGHFKTEVQDLMSQTRKAKNMDAMKDVRVELGRLQDEVTRYNDKIKEANRVDKSRESAIRQLNRYLRETHETNGALAQDNIRAVTQLAKRASTTRQMAEVQKQLNTMYKQQASIKDRGDREKALDSLHKKMLEYAKITGTSGDTINRRFEQIKKNVKGNLGQIESELAKWTKRMQDTQRKIDTSIANRVAGATVKGATAGKMKKLINDGDITAIKNYISQLEKINIATAKVSTNAKGVTRITTTLESTGKVAKQVTYEVDALNGSLRRMGQQDVFNRNANLGIFEQLRIAMARVPVWMTAMTAFYGSINIVKSMTSEILKLDKALTEIRRVASDNISIDTMFEGGVALSKELGNNVHDIMASIGELARTFGDFNERQLLAITRTATLMSNVSDLSTEEATNSLVGTMNAFNKSAEDSIEIVDAFNEVDNNFAISTKQLAEGMSKSASTARTFGVSMEESIGHITAIGAVTMESGKIIGNGLKTIYSRITTIEGAETALNDVGVAITDQEGRVRKVQPILEDLSDRWNTISDAQRQNIGVQVAGRYQLSRFLALMNNWQMASKATETAMHSEGSAMRENAEYMKSFESRINILKNSWTELASAVGDSVLTSSLLLAINSLTQLATVAIKVSENFGALPVVFGLIFVIMNKMKIFDKLKGSMESGARSVRRGWVDAGNSATLGATRTQVASARMNMAFGAVATGARTMATRVRTAMATMFLGIKGMVAGTGIGLAFVALGSGIEWLMKKYQEKKSKEEELLKLNKKMVDGYRSHRDGMDGMADRYEELSEKTNKTKEEQKEFNQIQADFAKQLPTTVEYVDANGKAHMKTNDAIRKEIESVKALSKAQADLDVAKYNEKLDKQATNFTKITGKIEKLREEQEKLVSQDGEKQVTTVGYGAYSNFTEQIVDNTKKIQENKVEMLMAESEKTEALKKTVKQISDQTASWLESNNMMSNVSDEQLKAVESFINYNEQILRAVPNEEEFKKAYEGLFSVGTQIGTVFSDAFDIMSSSIEENDPQKALKLDAIKSQLDGVAKTIPPTFYSLTDAQGRVVKSSDDVINGIKEIVNVTATMGSAGKDQTDQLIYRLQTAGLTAEEAQGYLYRLANEEDNLAIKAELASRGIDAETGSLESLNEEVMEAIDLTATLFGYSGSELEGLKSHIQAMHLLVDAQGEGAKSSQAYIDSQEAVSDFLGVTAEELEKNKDKYFNIIDALGQLNLAEYDTATSWSAFIKNNENLTPNQKEILLGWNGTKDIITGALLKTKEETKPVIDETKKNVEDIFKGVEIKFPKVDVTSIQGAKHYVETDVNDMRSTIDILLGKLGEVGIEVGTPTGVALFDGLMSELTIADGKIEATDANMYILRQALSTKIQNPNLTADINGSLDNTTSKAEKTMQTIGLIPQMTMPNMTTPFLSPVNTGLDNLNTKAGEVKSTWNETTGLFERPIAPNFNLMGLNTGITTLETAQTTAGKAQTATEAVVSAGSEVSIVSGDLKIVNEQADKTKEKISKLNSALGGLGDKFSTGAVRDQISKIGKALDTTKEKVGGLGSTLSGLAGLTTGGLPEYVRQLGLLSGNMVLASKYGKSTADAQANLVTAFTNVVRVTKDYNSAISNAGSTMGTTYTNLSKAIASATDAMIRAYQRHSQKLAEMVRTGDKSLKDMTADFDNATRQATVKVVNMSDQMHKAFKSGMDKIVATASGVPARIGKAIRDNMYSASGAMDEVAKDMVKRFKSELGIHSPSRVFEDLGYWTIKGLANGLTGGDLKNLGQDVFTEFGGEAMSSIDSIKDYMQFGASDLGLGASFGDYTKTSGFGMRMHPVTGEKKLHAGQDFAGRPNSPIQAKAGGRVVASGASGTGFGNYVKVQNGEYTYIYAHLNKAIAPVGSTVKPGQLLGLMGSTGTSTGTHLHYEVRKNGRPINPNGYQKGGFIDKEQIAKVGEHGRKEVVIPLEQYRHRARGLWTKAGEYLGIDPNLIEALRENMKGQRSKGGIAQGGAGSFGAYSGDGGGGESGGGDSGSSGIMQPSIYDGLRTVDGGYDFISLATNPRENIADAFKFNAYDRQQDGYEAQISLLEAKMNAMNKATVTYRDNLKKVVALQNSLVKSMATSLSITEKRQLTISKELKKLPSLSKQTTKQRETYNSLMQEYDGNIGKIASLKTEIQNMANDIKAKSLEIFTDFIDEIVTKYDKSIEAIKARIDNTEFSIDVMTLTNPNDKKGLLNAQVSKATDLQKQQSTAKNKVNSLQSQYNSTAKSKGASSKEALKVKEELDKAKEDYEDYTIAVLQAEKEIKDTRESVADEGIKVLQDYHTNVKDMAVEAIDLEIKALEDAHKKKMDLYDEEVEKINSVYDEKIKAMDEEKSEATYTEELNEKNTKKAELLNKISLLSRDNSLEGRKKVAELQKELADVNDEIANFQKERQDELLRQSLEQQKQAQLDAIALEKETAETKHTASVDGLEAQKELVQKQFEDLMSNDAYWAKMRDDAIKGNFTTLTTELSKMKTNLDNMNRGIFDGLFAGFKGLSDGVKKEIANLNGLNVDNMIGASKEPISDVKEATDANKYTMRNGAVQSNGTKVVTPNQTTPPPKKTTTPAKPAPKPSTGGSGSTGGMKFTKTLARGAKGAEVKALQKVLGVKQDGIFGNATYSALVKYQKANKLVADGIAGKATLTKMGLYGTTPKPSSGGSTGGSTSSGADRMTTSAVSFRKSAGYGNNIIQTLPKGAKVDYVGMEKGWAKIKYGGKTGFVGASFLKKFDTGGYTGDWAGREGKIAMLHKKELVLNERQTSDILDTATIMDKMTNILPDVKRSSNANKMATAGSIVNISYGDISVTVENGDKKKGNEIAKEIMKGIKKKGG